MASSEFRSKRGFRWIWLLLVLVILGIAYTLFHKPNPTSTDSAPGIDSIGMNADTANAGSQGLAANGADWKKVDFKSQSAADPDISDKTIRISASKDYTIFKMEKGLLFAPGESRLQPAAKNKLQQVAEVINKRYKAPSVAVFRGVDSTSDPSGNNKQLGIERALALKNWLVQDGGFAEEQVTIQNRVQVAPIVAQENSSKPEPAQEFVIVAYRKSVGSKGR